MHPETVKIQKKTEKKYLDIDINGKIFFVVIKHYFTLDEDSERWISGIGFRLGLGHIQQ